MIPIRLRPARMVLGHTLRKPSLPQWDSTIRLFGKTRNQGGFPDGWVLSKTREGFGRRLPPTVELGITGSLQELGGGEFMCEGVSVSRHIG